MMSWRHFTRNCNLTDICISFVFPFSRLLGFNRIPPVVGRLINVTSEVREITSDKKLARTFFTSPGVCVPSFSFYSTLIIFECENQQFVRTIANKFFYLSSLQRGTCVFTVCVSTTARQSTRCAAVRMSWRSPWLPCCPTSAWLPAGPGGHHGDAPTVATS